MLQRKMLAFMGGLTVFLVIAAIATLWLFQNVLGQLDRAAVADGTVLQITTDMTDAMARTEADLRSLQEGREHHLDALLQDIETLARLIERLGRDYRESIPQAGGNFAAIGDAEATFKHHVTMLATAQDPSLIRSHTNEAIVASATLRDNILAVAHLMRSHASQAERAGITRFRIAVLGLGILFLIVINTSFLVLLKVSNMVVRPVEKLVEGSRRLGREEFSYRVQMEPGDEFGELAGAYNRLAERLEVSESRKLETLQQTAIMLSHELNNASAIIKMQLKLLERQSTGNPSVEKSLRQIDQSLFRMTATIEALQHVRRIVLTDYSPTTKMLDLEKSTRD